MKPTLQEVLQALVDGKEVRNTCRLAGGWWSLDTYQTYMYSNVFSIDPSDHYQIRDKVRPHVHANIIKVWVENPGSYLVECQQPRGAIGETRAPSWHPDWYYRLIDSKTGSFVMESEGAK